MKPSDIIWKKYREKTDSQDNDLAELEKNIEAIIEYLDEVWEKEQDNITLVDNFKNGSGGAGYKNTGAGGAGSRVVPRGYKK